MQLSFYMNYATRGFRSTTIYIYIYIYIYRIIGRCIPAQPLPASWRDTGFGRPRTPGKIPGIIRQALSISSSGASTDNAFPNSSNTIGPSRLCFRRHCQTHDHRTSAAAKAPVQASARALLAAPCQGCAIWADGRGEEIFVQLCRLS